MSASANIMTAVRLHGPRDLRVERVPHPGKPGPGQVLLRVKSVGICGSDLHTYTDGRIGDTVLGGPLILGHEFGGVIEAAGTDARDGMHQPLTAGQRVAVDPLQPCHVCEMCAKGHPNLCINHVFCGLWPTHGALCEFMLVPADTCFPIPAAISDDEAVLLETLGVGIHAVDLAHIRVGQPVAVIGAGSIGMCCAVMAKAAGAAPLIVTEPLAWRREAARKVCDVVIDPGATDAAAAVRATTGGRGVDVVIEAAWSDQSVQQGVDMLAPGGRLVIVGIAGDDRVSFRHSAARRKGLTIAMCRRMKHTYPRAIRLVEEKRIEVASLVSHRFPLERAAEAFESAANYKPGTVKVMLHT